MAGKKSKSTGKISMGGRTEARKRQEAKRQAKFAKRREEGKVYKYAPIPFAEGTPEYYSEQFARMIKSRSKKLEYARLESVFAKLDNWVNKQNAKMKAVKENKEK